MADSNTYRHRQKIERLKAWAESGSPPPSTGPLIGKFHKFRTVLEHFWNTNNVKEPDLNRPTNIGYLVGTNVTRALLHHAYRPGLFWVRVENNTQHEHHAVNPVRREDVSRVLVALGFKGEARWTSSGANHVFGMPFDWRIRWRDMGGGHERIYFVRFGDTVKVLSPMTFHREFKREVRAPGLNEYLGSLSYDEDRLLRIRAKLEAFMGPDGKGYKMEKKLLMRVGRWCSKQVLADLGLAQ